MKNTICESHYGRPVYVYVEILKNLSLIPMNQWKIFKGSKCIFNDNSPKIHGLIWSFVGFEFEISGNGLVIL